MMDLSISTSAELQIDFDLLTPQLTDKPFQVITSKDSSTNTMEEDKETLYQSSFSN